MLHSKEIQCSQDLIQVTLSALAQHSDQATQPNCFYEISGKPFDPGIYFFKLASKTRFVEQGRFPLKRQLLELDLRFCQAVLIIGQESLSSSISLL